MKWMGENVDYLYEQISGDHDKDIAWQQRA